MLRIETTSTLQRNIDGTDGVEIVVSLQDYTRWAKPAGKNDRAMGTGRINSPVNFELTAKKG